MLARVMLVLLLLLLLPAADPIPNKIKMDDLLSIFKACLAYGVALVNFGQHRSVVCTMLVQNVSYELLRHVAQMLQRGSEKLSGSSKYAQEVLSCCDKLLRSTHEALKRL